MIRASGGPDTPQRNINNIPYLLRAMPMKASVKDGKILQLNEKLHGYMEHALSLGLSA